MVVQQPDVSTVTEGMEDDFFELGGSPMDDEKKEIAHEVLGSWKDSVFSQGPNDLGCTSSVKHRIHLCDDSTFKQRHRRIPPSQYDEVRQHLKQMLDCGVIRDIGKFKLKKGINQRLRSLLDLWGFTNATGWLLA